MKRTPLRKIGKQGKRNLEANKKIKELDLPNFCEMKLDGCMGNWPRNDKIQATYHHEQTLRTRKEFLELLKLNSTSITLN